jgi:hypothetical protein
MTEAKPKENAQSYFEKRCSELGVTKADNKIDLFTEDENTGQKTKKTFPIFTEDRQGNIDILIYTLKREIFVFDCKNR